MMYCIDRFEETYAVCEDDIGVMHDIPISELPKDSREGDVIFKNSVGVFEKNAEETQRRRDEVLRLLGRKQ